MREQRHSSADEAWQLADPDWRPCPSVPCQQVAGTWRTELRQPSSSSCWATSPRQMHEQGFLLRGFIESSPPGNWRLVEEELEGRASMQSWAQNVTLQKRHVNNYTKLHRKCFEKVNKLPFLPPPKLAFFPAESVCAELGSASGGNFSRAVTPRNRYTARLAVAVAVAVHTHTNRTGPHCLQGRSSSGQWAGGAGGRACRLLAIYTHATFF